MQAQEGEQGASDGAGGQPPGIPRSRRSKFSSMPPPGVTPQSQVAAHDQAGVSVDSNSSQRTQLTQFASAVQPQLGQPLAHPHPSFPAQQPAGYGAAPQGHAQGQQQPWPPHAAHVSAAPQTQQAAAEPAVQSQHFAHQGASAYGVHQPSDPMQAQHTATPQAAPAPQAQPAQMQLHPHAQPRTRPPELVAAPQDGALATRITKLAEFTTRNGPAFEEQVRAKQGSNVDYAFLHGGEGSDYYAWCLFCMARNLPIEQSLPEGWQDPLAQPAAGAAAPATAAAMPAAALPADAQAMPAEVSSGFHQVLSLLQGTQVRSALHEPRARAGVQAGCNHLRLSHMRPAVSCSCVLSWLAIYQGLPSWGP